MAVSYYSSSSPSWSDLLPELLDAVFNTVNDAREILNCATVCSSWRDSSSAVYTRRVLSPKNLDRKWVCGSTLGFLLTVSVSFPFDVHLINPFTNTGASLPPLISFEDFKRVLPNSETLNNFVKKAVSSTNLLEDTDWVVLVIYDTDRKLAFCRRGDKQWTGFESDQVASSSVDDIVFCNGVFLAIDRVGEIYQCELCPNNPKAIPLCSVSPFRYDPCKKYFAESDYGELWVVLKKLELNDDCDFTIYFEIYEFDSETKDWRKVRSLGGKALFLTPQGRCIAVIAGETGSRGFVKDNSIYFIDGNDGSLNLSVFEWDSKQIKKIYQPRSWNSQMFWVTPIAV